ncbi:hypothetical protein BSL78_18597, partial [Apostichopus japonicus]
PEPTCVSNIHVAAETLTLHKPDEAHSEDGRFGVYHCNFNSFYVKRHTPVLLYNQDVLIPKDAKRSFVVSVGEELTLCVDDVRLPKNCVNQLEWVLDGIRTEKLRRWNGSPCVHIKRVTTADAGIYEAYRRPVGRNAKQHAYFIVIVRPLTESPCLLVQMANMDILLAYFNVLYVSMADTVQITAVVNVFTALENKTVIAMEEVVRGLWSAMNTLGVLVLMDGKEYAAMNHALWEHMVLTVASIVPPSYQNVTVLLERHV